MIRRHVSAVLGLRDGYTGKPLQSAATVQIRVDGRPICPVFKPGGYFALCDLPFGPHALAITSPLFQEERVQVVCDRARCIQLPLDLKPGERYPFDGEVTRVHGVLWANGAPLGDAAFYLIAGTAALKLAQDKVQGGDASCKVYLAVKQESLRLPGDFVVADDAPELCRVSGVRDQRATLPDGFANAHMRGAGFHAAQTYRTQPDGHFFFCTRQPEGLRLYVRWENALHPFSPPIAPGGTNALELRL